MARFNLLKKLSFATAGAACIALGAVNTAHAATVIDTTPSWNGIDAVGAFGDLGRGMFTPFETIGQTFTVGSDNILNDFSFWLNDDPEPFPFSPYFGNNDFIDFAAYVMAWDGSKATGDILYQSEQKSTTSATGWEQFTFNTGGLNLISGQQYIAFLSASNFFDGINGVGQVGTIYSDPYPGGGSFISDNGSNFSSLTEKAWSKGSELAFKATFTSSTPPQSVPEPASMLGLLAVGSWGICQVLKRKQEQ